MSLGRLLSAAKALTRVSEVAPPYRLRRRGLLPKFSAGSDPFGCEKQPTVTTADSAAASTTDVPVPEGKPRGFRWPWKRRDSAPWPFAVGSPKSRSGTPAGAGQTPVQGELSLEKVKVVRNDLRESDVDLVVRSDGSDARGLPAKAGQLLGAMSAEKALDRLAERIVGAGMR